MVVEKVIGGWRGGEGGEAMLAVVGKVVRMAWFVEMRVWLWWWKCGWSKITIAKEKRLPQRSQPGNTNNSL